ncbi:MAG: methylcobamide--CoM methyltransferase [Peptococcaceae bacterium]|nr:methylcobamide--CoM methyltransferase [Peptococcaceae bacterium]
MNMKKWKEALLNSEIQALPVLTYPGLQITGQTIMDVVTDGHAQYELMKAVADRYPTAGAVSIMDLSVEAEAFGSEIRYSDNEVPAVFGKLVVDENSVKALQVPDLTKGRIPEYLKAVELSAKNIKRPVFGGCIGPFSLAGRLYGMTEIMTAMRRNANTIHLLLEKCTELIVEYNKAIKQAGAQGVIMAEPAAGLLSERFCQKFSSDYVKKIVDAVQDDNYLVILHNCGQTKHLVNSMVSTGAEGFHFGNAVDMADILPQIPQDKLVGGNIAPVDVFQNGSVYTVMKETMSLLEKGQEYPNFFISSGCDIPPGTPLENVDAFFKTIALFNQHQQRKIS